MRSRKQQRRKRPSKIEEKAEEKVGRRRVKSEAPIAKAETGAVEAMPEVKKKR